MVADLTFQSLAAKREYIQRLNYLVLSRWFLHAGILLLGLFQKALGVAEFNYATFGLLALTYSYNLAYYIYLHRRPEKISWYGLRAVAALQIGVDLVIYSIVIYATGGIESYSFLFYFVAIFMAIFIFRWQEILLFSILSVVAYLSIIILEFDGFIPHQARYQFDPGFFQNFGVTVHNSATIALIFMYIAFFATFIGYLMRQHEEEVVRERDKVKEFSQLKSEFISLVAHQVRTPLTGTSWMFQNLLDGDSGPLTPKQIDLLTKGTERNRAVLEMVNNLLHLSRLEEGKFLKPFAEIDLKEVVYKIFTQLNDLAKAQKIKLQFKAAEAVDYLLPGDKEKIEMVITNLLDNAIKYNTSGGAVVLTLTKQVNFIELTVKDTGIGITPADQPKIFSRFFRAPAAQAKVETGSGLGLYIVQRIIAAHHGKIWFKSAPGKGTTFYINLPR